MSGKEGPSWSRGRGGPERPDLEDGSQDLRQAFEELERELSPWLARWSARLRRPEYRKVRIVLALGFIASSALWFLPIFGIEFLPLGLLLLAVDVPFLRRPMARALLWLLDRWSRLRAWWTRIRSSDRA